MTCVAIIHTRAAFKKLSYQMLVKCHTFTRCSVCESAGCERRYHVPIRAKLRSTLQNNFVGDYQALDVAAAANGHRGISMNEGLIHAHIVADSDIALLAVHDEPVRKSRAGANLDARLVDKNRVA